ncbi:MAG: methyltransferase [Alphaproteobacteria bacterium]
MAEANDNGAQNALDKLTELTGAYWLSRCVHVAADLGVADALGDEPQPIEQLAATVKADPHNLKRVMRLLVANGLFAFENGRYLHNEQSRRLRSDHPHSMRPIVRFMGLPIQWAAIGELEYAVRTGRPSNEKIAPGGLFAYLAQHPEEARIFNEAMTAKAHDDVLGVPRAYDFSRFSTIGDIGGGRGHLLRAVLDVAPRASGVLFDLPPVIDAAREIASNRIRLQAGDFFKDALPACDAYLLMSVIHDWSDEQARDLLGAVRRAAPSHAKVLIIETVLPDEPKPHLSRLGDIALMAMTTGQARTQREFADLFTASGLTLERKIDTNTEYSILEAAVAA